MLDEQLEAWVRNNSSRHADLAIETIQTAMKLALEDIDRLDRKIANAALKEMRHAFRIFAPYKAERKATIFGSARTQPGDPEYIVAREVAEKLAAKGWMVITGAGPGIMAAGHEGAGAERSFGANIRLPFEASPNPVIADDAKLINFKYFFTRKLTFMKEADAFILLPGGFGTLDEAFELLTLIQTGKSDPHPIVLLDRPGGDYWASFDDFVREDLLKRAMIDEADLRLYSVTDNVDSAVTEIERFYRVYHSQRIVDGQLVLRLTIEPNPSVLESISLEFADALQGPLEIVGPSVMEISDSDVPDLPRLTVRIGRQYAGLVRQIIDALNRSAD